MREIKFRALVRFSQHETYHWLFYTPKTREGEFEAVTGIKVEDLQYTGFKANDKEIYEGDIVDFQNGYIDKMIFIDGCFRLKTENYKEDLSHGTVIGNIYENPELLEGKEI